MHLAAQAGNVEGFHKPFETLKPNDLLKNFSSAVVLSKAKNLSVQSPTTEPFFVAPLLKMTPSESSSTLFRIRDLCNSPTTPPAFLASQLQHGRKLPVCSFVGIGQEHFFLLTPLANPAVEFNQFPDAVFPNCERNLPRSRPKPAAETIHARKACRTGKQLRRH